MIAFAVFAALLVVGALLLVLPPLLRPGRGGASAGMPRQSETALAVLREQLAELDAERAAGRLDDAEYKRTREELERRALDEGQGGDGAADRRSAPRWAVAVGVGLPLGALVLYLVLGSPAGLDPTKVAGEAPAMSRAQIEKMVGELATRMKAEPDNAEGWTMLARSYLVLGKYADAVAAYEHLSTLKPDSADVYADWADAVAATAGHVTPEAERLAQRALTIAPNHFKALALAGTGAYEREDYKQAATLWERILAQVSPDDKAADTLRASIDEARTKAGLPPLPAAQAGGAEEGGGKSAASAPLTVRGEVRLDPSLAAKASADDTVFVFVRAPGSRMPLAGMRLTVAQLPAKFDFAGVPLLAQGAPVPAQVVIGARVSKSGNAMPAAGDLEGFSAPVATDAAGVAVVIDRVR